MNTHIRSLMVTAISSVLINCGSDAASPTKSGPPVPIADSPACVISADCPAGSHCDLGECVQECNAEVSCSGKLSCSPRARCLPASAPDADPEPTTSYAGSVSAASSLSLLTEADNKLSIELSTTSTETVRYRVALVAPHLSIAEPRGEFVGKTTVSLEVHPELAASLDQPGTVRILTTLGEVVVDAPVHVGITGRYQGSLSYDGDALALGAARLSLDLLEKNGNVSARVDGKTSLLFPATAAGDATGHGSFDGKTISLTLAQRIEKDFGNDRNRFAREIGRRITFALEPAGGGRVGGTFKEVIYGLFSDPVELTGRVSFELIRGGGAPEFTLGAAPEMPAGLSVPPVDTSAFGFVDTCFAVNGSVTCPTKLSDPAACAPAVEAKFYDPLSAKLEKKGSGALPMADVAVACEAALGVTTLSGFSGDAAGCALPPALACATAASIKGSAASSATARAFHRQLARTLAPGLLVAQEKMVQGLYKSFSEGAAKERDLYLQAQAVLAPSAAFTLQPGLLEFMRKTSAGDASGEPGSTDPTASDFPAARSFARLLLLSSKLDGELARLDGSNGQTDHATSLRLAQERAVITFLESAALAKVLETWGASPPASVGVVLSGVLGPVDTGFAALVQGPSRFGIPEGFVPFVYRAEDAGKAPTNFEQMLVMAQTPVAQAVDDQAAFENNKRTYEQNEQSLKSELAQVRSSFDLSLKQICGAGFDPDAISAPGDWKSCGAGKTGELGSLFLDIEQSLARLQSAENRIHGAKQKMAISRDQLAGTQAVHASTLRFIDAQGQMLEAITWSEGIINAAQTAINTSSEASVLNFGAPAALAGLNAMLEMQKTALAVARQRLQTAQTMKFTADAARIELINGMADIQKQAIDLAQLEVDIHQDVIGVLQSKLRLSNTFEQAKELHEERSRSLALVSQSPAKDPSYRLLRDSFALAALSSRADAQRSLYLSGRALEYEINQPLTALPGAVLGARDAGRLKKLSNCLTQIHDAHRVAYGSPQQYQTEVSLRRTLGITGPRTDEVTGQTLTEGELFRMELLKNQNLDGAGGVGLTFGTNLQPGNGLFPTDVCSDKVASVRVQLVGDFLGDAAAQVNLSLSGGSVMRQCSGDALTNWSLGAGNGAGSSGFAVIQAGVNGWSTAPPNTSLFGQSVARASWRVVLPGPADAPSNADLDLTHLEDIVFELTHKALPRSSAPLAVDVTCLAAIGG